METLVHIYNLIESNDLILDSSLFINQKVIKRFYILLKISINEKNKIPLDEWLWKEDIRFDKTKLALSLCSMPNGKIIQINHYSPEELNNTSEIIEKYGGTEEIVKDMRKTLEIQKQKLGEKELEKRFNYMMKIENYYVW